jgi:hypothetical protein
MIGAGFKGFAGSQRTSAKVGSAELVSAIVAFLEMDDSSPGCCLQVQGGSHAGPLLRKREMLGSFCDSVFHGNLTQIPGDVENGTVVQARGVELRLIRFATILWQSPRRGPNQG